MGWEGDAWGGAGALRACAPRTHSPEAYGVPTSFFVINSLR